MGCIVSTVTSLNIEKQCNMYRTISRLVVRRYIKTGTYEEAWEKNEDSVTRNSCPCCPDSRV